jgi:predicted lipid-binding transport protein (Tim44 family)
MLFAMFMYGLLALGANGLIAWIDRKIAAIRYEAMFKPAVTPVASSDVVTVPAAAPAAASTVPAAAPAAPSTVPAAAPAAPSTVPGATPPGPPSSV